MKQLKIILLICSLLMLIPTIILSNGKKQKKDSKVKELFSIVLKKNNALSDTTEDNVEYPSDIQYFDHKIYILSGHERKVVIYDLKSDNLTEFEGINKTLKSMYAHDNKSSEPEFIRILNKYIIIDCNDKVLIFDKDGELIKKLIFQHNIQYITAEGNKLYIWSYNEITKVNLDDKFQFEKIKTSIDLPYVADDDLVAFGGDLFDEFKGLIIVSSQDSATLKTIDTKQINYVEYPEIMKRNVSLNCVTPLYYVWYSWIIGPEFFIINKNSGATNKIPLPINITQDYLSEEEGGGSRGFKITNNADQFLYIMVMKRENRQKKIIVYELDL